MKKNTLALNKLLILLTAVFTLTANAQATDTEWARGLQAFGQQDYALALSLFSEARNKGQSGPAVHYNIGVCQYKLEDYKNAATTFQFINDNYPKMRPLAEYNLGLVAFEQGHRQVAGDHFRKAYGLSADDEKLRILSSNMLRKTLPPTEAAAGWIRTVSLQAGYDDNVTLLDETGLPAGFDAASPFAELVATVRGPYSGSNGFRFDGTAYLANYMDAADYNQGSVRGGAFYDWRASGWGVKAGAHGTYTTLGGIGYERGVGYSIKASRALTPTTSLLLSFRGDNLNSVDAIYAGIEGDRQQVEIRYRWYDNYQSLNLAYVFESNDRLDASVSPNRNKAYAAYRYTPESGFGFFGSGEWRNSDYNDLAPTRQEDLSRLSLGASYALRSGWEIQAQLMFENNDSNDAIYSYKRNQISLGLFRIF